MKKIIAITGLLIVIVTYIGNSLISPSDDDVKALSVMSNCWQEESKICKQEEKGDTCLSGVHKLCAAKHPQMSKVFWKRANTCSRRHGGSLIDNRAVWICAGADK